MRSYKHLWDRLISDDNIREAIILAGKNKNKRTRRHQLLRIMKKDPDRYIDLARSWIVSFRSRKHKAKEIHDGVSGKLREIIVPSIAEVIVQQAVVNILKPLLMRSMYEHSYASIPYRGTHRGKRQLAKWLRSDRRNTKYCLKLDIRKFFNSIPQDKLLASLRRVIRDDRFFKLIEVIVHTVPEGVPLGFNTSQWFANWYLTPLDHYIKGELEIPYYIRFMDDMVLTHSNKRKLHKIRLCIRDWLAAKGLELKANWTLFKVSSDRHSGRFIDFLGFKIYPDRVTLRRKVALKAQRKARRIKAKPHATIYDCRQMITYLGYLRHVQCHKWFTNHIKPYIRPHNIRLTISRHDKLQAAS